MLRKLIKHELRATQRLMLPMFAAVFVLTLGMIPVVQPEWLEAGLSGDNYVLQGLYAAISVLYSFSIFGLFAVLLGLMVWRFHKNFLDNEGYVMLTLPVSLHKLIWSKLLTTLIWFAGGVLLSFLSSYLLILSGDGLLEMQRQLAVLWQEAAESGFNLTAAIVEWGIIGLIAVVAFCLQVYASAAIGHSLGRRKMLYSVLIYVGIQFVLQIGWTITAFGFAFTDSLWLHDPYLWVTNPMVVWHTGVAIIVIPIVLLAVLFYFLTVYFMKNRLNLE